MNCDWTVENGFDRWIFVTDETCLLDVAVRSRQDLRQIFGYVIYVGSSVQTSLNKLV